MPNDLYEAIRNNISENSKDLEVANTMPNNLLDLWQNNLNQLNEQLIDGLSETESPIEKMFLIEFNFVNLIRPSWLDSNDALSTLFIQHPVAIGEHDYRVDFELLIDVFDNYAMNDSPTATKIFIELDMGMTFMKRLKNNLHMTKNVNENSRTNVMHCFVTVAQRFIKTLTRLSMMC